MPRRLRIHIPGGFYHVTLRGNHQRAIFHSDQDAELLIDILARALAAHGVRAHAYCWMTNHIHLLLQVGAEPLSTLMRRTASEFARRMQRKMETTGHFFERRYHATIVDSERYLKEVVRYIHLNPVAAGVVSRACDHRWSSHHNYVGRIDQAWLTTDCVLQAFGQTRGHAMAAYEAFMQDLAVPEWASRLEIGSDAADVLGDDEFIARLRVAKDVLGRKSNLDELVADACRRFMISEPRLRSPLKDPFLARVRAWIAKQARENGIATLSAVARRLERSEATLRQAIEELPPEFR